MRKIFDKERMNIHAQLVSAFPRIATEGYQVTSPPDSKYNCIAWAAGDTSRWWWPALHGYWPPNSPREESLDAFVQTFGNLGYTPCDSREHESGYMKIAFYAKGGKPTHAARQIQDGRWTSKLGDSMDLTHHTLVALEGDVYGQVEIILSRPEQE